MKKRKQIHKQRHSSFLSKNELNKPSPYQEDILVEVYEEEIDERLESLNEHLGREITDDERKALLGVVEQYSPKYKNGSIIEYLPFEFAWSIYEATKDDRLDEFLRKLKLK